MQVSSSVQSATTSAARRRTDSANPFRIREFIEPDAFGTTYYDSQKPNQASNQPDITNFDKLQQKRQEQSKLEQAQELKTLLERLTARKAELEGAQGMESQNELGKLTGRIGTLQNQMAQLGSGAIGGLLGFTASA